MTRYGTEYRERSSVDLREWGRRGRGYDGEFGGRRGGFLGGWGAPSRERASGFFHGRGRRGTWMGSYDRGYRRGYDRDLGHRLREGWRDMKRSAHEWFRGGRYDRGW
jgi:hypothetical protein